MVCDLYVFDLVIHVDLSELKRHPFAPNMLEYARQSSTGQTSLNMMLKPSIAFPETFHRLI